MQITVGIITISDRAAAGEYDDLGGPALKAAAQNYGWQVLSEAIVPDEISRIRETIRSFSDQGCGLILATGGTGVAERDVTPEAIRGMMRVELPGFGETMRRESMKITPNAILSRSLAAWWIVRSSSRFPENHPARWSVSVLWPAPFRMRSLSPSAFRPRAERTPFLHLHIHFNLHFRFPEVCK